MRKYLTIFDTETTGVDNRKDWIYQIAAKTVLPAEGFRTVPDGEFEVKMILPPEGFARLKELKKHAPEVVTYDVERWDAEGVSVAEGIHQFVVWLRKWQWFKMTSKKGKSYRCAVLGGYNTDFDLRMLRGLNTRYHSEFLPVVPWGMDVLQLARWAMVFDDDTDLANYKLQTIAARYGIDPGEAHEAMSDVNTTIELIKLLLRDD